VTLGYNESAAYIMSRIRNEAPEYTVHQEFFTMGYAGCRHVPPMLLCVAALRRWAIAKASAWLDVVCMTRHVCIVLWQHCRERWCSHLGTGTPTLLCVCVGVVCGCVWMCVAVCVQGSGKGRKHTHASAGCMAQVTPDAIKYSFGAQFSTMGNQGGGYANASLAVANNRGCHADDFPATVSGRVVLIKRGDCTFHDKVQFAQAAGAVGALIYNDGDAEDRFGVVSGTLGEPATSIPVFGIDFAMGDALAHMAPVVPVTMASTFCSTVCIMS